jgi:hypothetical protein
VGIVLCVCAGQAARSFAWSVAGLQSRGPQQLRADVQRLPPSHSPDTAGWPGWAAAASSATDAAATPAAALAAMMEAKSVAFAAAPPPGPAPGPGAAAAEAVAVLVGGRAAAGPCGDAGAGRLGSAKRSESRWSWRSRRRASLVAGDECWRWMEASWSLFKPCCAAAVSVFDGDVIGGSPVCAFSLV